MKIKNDAIFPHYKNDKVNNFMGFGAFSRSAFQPTIETTLLNKILYTAELEIS